MQGIYIMVGPNAEGGRRRPKSKKEIRETAADRVLVEATSLFGNEYEGAAAALPAGTRVHFVGPDPYTSRRFYGTLERISGRVVVR